MTPVATTDSVGRPTPGSSSATLLNDIWVLTTLEGQPITATAQLPELPRLEIMLYDQRVGGTTGCNNLNGRITADAHTVEFGPIMTTRRACLDEVANTRETKFLRLLQGKLTYRIANMTLTLSRDGQDVMTFKKVD